MQTSTKTFRHAPQVNRWTMRMPASGHFLIHFYSQKVGGR
jgi:hypothetical protein